MEKRPVEPQKIYVTLIGCAPMASLDALMMSLERFKDILTSDSARDCFETTLRSVLPSLQAVNDFIDVVYAQKNPNFSISMKGRSLIVELNQTKEDFLECIHDYDVDEILSHLRSVGTMPAKRLLNQKAREYIVFPIRYKDGKFIKLLSH